jgi:hypothetical protein
MSSPVDVDRSRVTVRDRPFLKRRGAARVPGPLRQGGGQSWHHRKPAGVRLEGLNFIGFPWVFPEKNRDLTIFHPENLWKEWKEWKDSKYVCCSSNVGIRSQNSMNICINTCACALFFAQNNMGYRCYDYLFHPVFICYIMDRLQWIYWVFLAPGPQ